MSNTLYENIHMIPDNIPCASAVSLTVSSDQPYLKDHDVGMPLFGTVLSLEAMAESRSCIFQDKVTQIRNVIAGEDCLFPPGTKNELICRIRAQELALYHNGQLVFQCCMSSDDPDYPPELAVPIPASILSHPHGASRNNIYSSLFHGPSFQVLEEAVAYKQYIISKMNRFLPPLSDAPGCSTVLPVRLIEFCLQSFGMWELAFTDCVSVPLSIIGINILHPQTLGPIYAVAENRMDGGHIFAIDHEGKPIIEISGYKTRQMPYGENHADELRAKLLHGA